MREPFSKVAHYPQAGSFFGAEAAATTEGWRVRLALLGHARQAEILTHPDGAAARELDAATMEGMS